MKRLIALTFAVVCVLSLAGCQEQVSNYSFRGEHEYFAISNVSINLDDKKEVFDGGKIEITQSGFFEEVASYSTTFYVLINGEQNIILSNSVIDQTGDAVSIDSDLGSISGEGVVIGNGVENIDELSENLWFELKTTDLNGEEKLYQIQLTITE